MLGPDLSSFLIFFLLKYRVFDKIVEKIEIENFQKEKHVKYFVLTYLFPKFFKGNFN